MRNYLRADQSKKHKQKLWRNPSLAVSLLMLVATLLVAQHVHAIGQECTTANNSTVIAGGAIGGIDPTNGNPVANFPAGSHAIWTNGNFAFRVYDLWEHKGPGNPNGATTGGTCGVSFHINTNTSEFEWNGVRPVDVRLGVPNMGAANNDGVWAPPNSAGTGTPVDQPPQFDSDFQSYAGYVDDGGMATIAGSVANTSFQTLWCNKFVPGAINAGGAVNGGLLAGDASTGCPNDITQFPNQDGTGYLFTTDNCHFGDAAHGITNMDSNGSGPYNCANYPGNTTSANSINAWYWTPMAALSGASPVTGGAVTEKDALSLRNHIGCNGGGPCDGRSLPIDSFDIHEYARNHTFTDPSNEAFSSSAHTILTFAYPIPPVLTITKTPTGCYFPINTPMSSSTCPSVSTSASYLIGVREDADPNFLGAIPTLATASVVDTVPDYVNAICIPSLPENGMPGPNCVGLGSPHGAGCPNLLAGDATSPSPAWDGVHLTWSFTAGELARLQAGDTIHFCYDTRTRSPVATPLAFSNSATFSVQVASTNQPFSANVTTQNFIVSPQYPALANSGGDVHAGGLMGTCSGNSPSSVTYPGAVEGQSANTYSQGQYIVSGSGTGIFGAVYPSFPGTSTGELSASDAYAVCRPNLAANVASYSSPGLTKVAYDVGSGTSPSGLGLGCSVTPEIGCLMQHNYGTGGALIIANNNAATPLVIPNAVITSRVTVYSPNSVVINASTGTSYAGTPAAAQGLGSLGIIAAGDIGINSGTTSLVGFLYAGGQITTCTNSAGTPWTPPNIGTSCYQDLTLTGLMSAHNFDFNRTGPKGGTNPYDKTENINYTGLFLLATPPVFDQQLTAGTGAGPTTIQVLPPQY